MSPKRLFPGRPKLRRDQFDRQVTRLKKGMGRLNQSQAAAHVVVSVVEALDAKARAARNHALAQV